MKKILSLFLLIFTLQGCVDDLDTQPELELSLEQLLAEDPNAVNGILSRLYASFALSSPSGPGSSDIDGDAGEGTFLRGIINLQDLSADGMKNRWGDDGLDQLTTTSDWDENNKFFGYLFNRMYYSIAQANNLIGVLNSVAVENSNQLVAEAQFIRALSYYYLIDVFGKGVLATEDNLGESNPLPEASRSELFDYAVSQMLEAEQNLPQTNSYGRATKGAAQMLLAKLYLNAEVYTGTAMYDQAYAYAEKVINDGGYSLEANFVKLFSKDNDTSAEIIFPLIADADVSQAYGNTTYVVNGCLSTETMEISQYGAAEGWTGHSATKAWYGLFGSSAQELNDSDDSRAALFWTQGHSFEMDDYKQWGNGFGVTKFRNTDSNGGGTPTSFSSTDFPLFRLADAHLMSAEAILRGGGGSNADALAYVNAVRARSGAAAITSGDLDLDFILDERARELNLEGHRRSDLIRFGKFTGSSYVWPWKGNTANGASIPNHYNLYPLPLTALSANPNLTQNQGF